MVYLRFFLLQAIRIWVVTILTRLGHSFFLQLPFVSLFAQNDVSALLSSENCRLACREL